MHRGGAVDSDAGLGPGDAQEHPPNGIGDSPYLQRAIPVASGGTHLIGTWAFGARLDLELDALAADEAVEVERGIE